MVFTHQGDAKLHKVGVTGRGYFLAPELMSHMKVEQEVEAASRTWEYWTKADLPTHWYPGVAIDSMVACSQAHSYSSRMRNV